MASAEGQEMVFLNGGPAHQLNPAFSFFVRCVGSIAKFEWSEVESGKDSKGEEFLRSDAEEPGYET